MKAAVLTLLLAFLHCSLEQTVELKYALFTATDGFDSSGAVPAIELAEKMVNSNDSVLSGYILSHTGVRDTLCNRALSLNLFFEAIPEPNPPVLGLLGCGCSVASTPVAEIVHHKSLSQVSYASSSVELDDSTRFPNFFRTYPSDAEFTPVFLSIVQEFGWKRVAFLTQEEGIFTGRYERLIEPLARMNITVQNRMFASQLPINGLNRSSRNFFFEDNDYRVFLVNSYSEFAQHIICEAFKRGFTYPRYAWITYAWYADEWWTQAVNPSAIDCTDNNLAEFLHRSLATQIIAVPMDENTTTDTGLTEREFLGEYAVRLATSNYSFSYLAPIAYDTLWSLAFALDSTNRMINDMARKEILNITGCEGEDKQSGFSWELVPLENFTIDNMLMGCVIRWNLERIDFTGVSGRVQFNEVGSRFQGHSQIFQYRTDESIRRDYIALTDYEGDRAVIVFLNDESIDTVYPDGIPPDGTPINQINTFHLALVVIYYIIAALGVLFSTACLIFNVTQRNKKVVRLTSPNLNYFLIAGTYIMYISVFLRLLPSTTFEANYARCIMDAVVNSIGYCMAFGVVLVKMGRINYIFNNPTTSKMAVKDWHLILITLGITGFGVLLVLLQVAIPHFRPVPNLVADREYGIGVDENGIRINHMVYDCSSGSATQATSWIVVTFLYLALLQVVGIVLAIQTRKVKVKILNDSKYIAALIYISSIVLVTRAVSVFAVPNLLNVREAIFSGGILVISTSFLSLVFIPKMISLIRDPEGEKVFDKTGESDLAISITGRKISVLDEQDQKIKELEAKVAQLERKLEQQKLKNGVVLSGDQSKGQTAGGVVNQCFRDTETKGRISLSNKENSSSL